MSITGVLLMAAAGGAFDSQSNIDPGYEETGSEFNNDYQTDESAADGFLAAASEEEEDTTQLPDENTVSADVDIEQAKTWADQLVAIDEKIPNDAARIAAYQNLMHTDNNPYVPILMANTLVNMNGQSREVDVYENQLQQYDFDREALTHLDQLGTDGDANAMYLLGVYYYQTRHYEAAKSWLEQAANRGNSNAMNQLAWIYREGLGVAEDMGEAIDWHRRAAEAGSARAMTNLGYLYSMGIGVEKGQDTAAFWYQQAANLNSASGLYAIAVYYLNGSGGYRQDSAKGVRLLLKSAELGHERAMYAIGRRYEHGDGVSQDMNKAIYWYEQAAELDEPDAIVALRQIVNGVWD